MKKSAAACLRFVACVALSREVFHWAVGWLHVPVTELAIEFASAAVAVVGFRVWSWRLSLQDEATLDGRKPDHRLG